MELLLYIILAAVYIVTINLAVAGKNQFNFFLMVGIFVLGAVIGFYFDSYEAGFALSVILSLIFW